MTKHRTRAQSAMEYLMTYGWAILIIAVVLGALFALGVFNQSGLSANACVAPAGFYCENAIFYHGVVGSGSGSVVPGNIVLTVGQDTGAAWQNIFFVFVPAGTGYTSGLPNVNFATPPTGISYAVGNMNTGSSTQVTLPVTGTSSTVSIGTTETGEVWAQYMVGGNVEYTQIASLNIKAT